MALVWFDGFDHLTAAQMTRKYDTFGGGVLSGTNTRFNSGQCSTYNSAVQGMTKTLVSNQAWRIGCAVSIVQGTALTLLYLIDAGTTQCTLTVENRQLYVRHNNGTLIANSTLFMNLNTWYHVEWYQVIADSIGTNGCVVKVNGETWLTGNSGDTKNTSNASADRFGTNGSGGTQYNLDDVYVYHDAVTTTPSFSGDMRVVQLTPNGDGNYSQFTGSDGNSVNNYLLVDEAQANDDTDYVETDVVSNRDSYALSNLAVTPVSIAGVSINSVAKKGDAGARTGRLFFRISGTDYESADFSPSTSYFNQMYLAELSPATSSAWGASEVNGMEAGVKVQS